MKDPATSIAVNVAGTANVFAAARDHGVRRIVYASSSSVYGDSDRLPKREGEEGEPLSPYARSKAMDEELAATFHRCYQMEFVGLRYFNVYGPRQDPDGDYAAVIPRFFKAYLSGEAPVIYGDGTQSRDFTYVSDAVEANLRAAQAPVSSCGRAYNVAGGRQTSVNDLASAVREAAGGGPPPRYQAPRPGDVLHSAADLSRRPGGARVPPARRPAGGTGEISRALPGDGGSEGVTMGQVAVRVEGALQGVSHRPACRPVQDASRLARLHRLGSLPAVAGAPRRGRRKLWAIRDVSFEVRRAKWSA